MKYSKNIKVTVVNIENVPDIFLQENVISIISTNKLCLDLLNYSDLDMNIMICKNTNQWDKIKNDLKSMKNLLYKLDTIPYDGFEIIFNIVISIDENHKLITQRLNKFMKNIVHKADDLYFQ